MVTYQRKTKEKKTRGTGFSFIMDVMGVAFIKDLPDRFGMAETIFISANVPAVTSTDQFFL